ncbi:MAG: ferritin family protein [Candidatus Omnitrophota bacterium]|nr:ferritin family protein [Candidatus Omnitrophota bacterium]
MNVFSISEIVDLGIEKEKKRRDFYAAVSEYFKDKDMKELFIKLKNWEEEHIKKFSEMRDAIKEPKETDSYEGEMDAYMQALVDDRLYSQVAPISFKNNVKTPMDAISYGIGFEKDAILFFNEIVKYTADSRKEIVKKLIEEEKKHIVYLASLRQKLQEGA